MAQPSKILSFALFSTVVVALSVGFRINPGGDIVGAYVDFSGKTHALVRTMAQCQLGRVAPTNFFLELTC